jgi:hypothetical protein
LHGSPSSQLAPPATFPVTHSPVDALHTLVVHGFPVGAHTTAVPAVHTPLPSHVSAPLHRSPSLQETPIATGVWTHPPDAHESAVHGLPSSQLGAPLEMHIPLALQVSVPLHALPSSHDAPDAAGVFEQPVDGSHASTVHGFVSPHVSDVPA